MYPVSNSIIIKRSIAVKKSFNFHLKVTMNRIQNTKKEEPHMKITVAIDSLKGSLASMEAGNSTPSPILASPKAAFSASIPRQRSSCALWQMAAREPWMP